jgi:hypothetical protein
MVLTLLLLIRHREFDSKCCMLVLTHIVQLEPHLRMPLSVFILPTPTPEVM